MNPEFYLKPKPKEIKEEKEIIQRGHGYGKRWVLMTFIRILNDETVRKYVWCAQLTKNYNGLVRCCVCVCVCKWRPFGNLKKTQIDLILSLVKWWMLKVFFLFARKWANTKWVSLLNWTSLSHCYQSLQFLDQSDNVNVRATILMNMGFPSWELFVNIH